MVPKKLSRTNSASFIKPVLQLDTKNQVVYNKIKVTSSYPPSPKTPGTVANIVSLE